MNNKSREWALRILSGGNDEASDSYFINKYMKPALLCGTCAMVLMYYYNFSTLTGYFEAKVFFIAAILTSAIICKRVKKITKIKQDTAFGKAGSNDFVQLILMTSFSCLVSIFVVWCLVSANMLFDRSSTRIMNGEIKGKKLERFLFWSSHKLAFSLDIQRMGIRYAVDEHQFSEMSSGQRVILQIKDGALGVPYIAAVKNADKL